MLLGLEGVGTGHVHLAPVKTLSRQQNSGPGKRKEDPPWNKTSERKIPEELEGDTAVGPCPYAVCGCTTVMEGGTKSGGKQ